jgi:hypothetical protein
MTVIIIMTITYPGCDTKTVEKSEKHLEAGLAGKKLNKT